MSAERLQTVLKIIGALRQPRTVAELADISGLNLKTMRRELAMLREAGFDLRSNEGDYNCKSWRVVAPMRTLSRLMKPF